jgi:AcrR family transcriptional regulator
VGRRKGVSLAKADVVAAALEVVQAEGADALGISRVARELGIKPPSLYNHVRSGNELAWLVVLDANASLVAWLSAAVSAVDDPREQLRALAFGVRRWAKDNAGLYALMDRVKPDNEAPDAKPVLQELLGLFRRPLEQLGVPDGELVHAMRSLRSAVHGFVLLEASGQFQLADDPEESFAWLVQTWVQGVGEQ